MNKKRKYTIRGILMALLFCFGLMQGTMKVTAMGLEDIFDPEYYAQSNLDVADSMNPDRDILFRHFLSYGLAEGRSPGHALDVAAYREAYPDLAEAFGDDWDSYVQHYVTIGIKEARSNFALFSPIPYADANPDVKAAYGYDETALITHYLVFGIREHRPLFPKVEKKQISGTGVDNDSQSTGNSGGGGDGSHGADTGGGGSYDTGGDDRNSPDADTGNRDSENPDNSGDDTTKSITLSKSDTYSKLLAGNTTQIMAELEGYDSEATLLWQILTSGCAVGTVVDSEGVLSVDQSETNKQITVRARDSDVPEINDTISYDIFHIDKMSWDGMEIEDEIWNWSGVGGQIGDDAVRPEQLADVIVLYDGELEITADLSWDISSPESFRGDTYEETGEYVYEATVTCGEFEVPSTLTYTIEVTTS